MQTFVLAPQTPNKYYVHNDIFRYQDEVFADSDEEDELVEEDHLANQVSEKQAPPHGNYISLFFTAVSYSSCTVSHYFVHEIHTVSDPLDCL